MRRIARTLNRHPVFRDSDLKFTFEPNEMAIFQTDELERSQTFSMYVQAGLRHSVAGQLAGLNLPENVTFEQLDADEEERRRQSTLIPPQFRYKGAELPLEERKRRSLLPARNVKARL